MTKSDAEFIDSFEPILRNAHALMRAKKGDRACELLADAASQAVTRDDLEDAALFTSVRGSYLVALGRDEAALQAYLEAEKLGEGQAHYQLTTARHLIFGMKRPEDALAKVNELDSTRCSQSERLIARSLRGTAHLHLGKQKLATAELKAMLEETPPGLPSISHDLILVEMLLREPLAHEVCRRYLSLVETKAEKEGEDSILGRVRELKSMLQS